MSMALTQPLGIAWADQPRDAKALLTTNNPVNETRADEGEYAD
jgi:hypothetical protein